VTEHGEPGEARWPVVTGTEFDQEERLSRQQAAERLVDIAYALSAGVMPELGTVDDRVSVPVPDTVLLRRRSTATGDHVAVEVELSWSA
jgi:amphi-Trp domain-containing protein